GQHADEDVATPALGASPGAHRRHGGAGGRPAGGRHVAVHIGPVSHHRHPPAADRTRALEHGQTVTEGADRIRWTCIGTTPQPGWDEYDCPHNGEDQQQHSQAPRPTFATRGPYRDVIEPTWMVPWVPPPQSRVFRRMPGPFLLRRGEPTSNRDANSS